VTELNPASQLAKISVPCICLCLVVSGQLGFRLRQVCWSSTDSVNEHFAVILSKFVDGLLSPIKLEGRLRSPSRVLFARMLTFTHSFALN